MRRTFYLHYDRWCVGLALTTFAVSMTWFWQAQSESRRLRALPVAFRGQNFAYVARDFPAGAPASSPWIKPEAQAAGKGWIYDLFTPPAVFYHQKSGAFSVYPPTDLSAEASPWNIEVKAVKREPYRLQLIGYFGDLDDYTVVFSLPNSSGTLRAKAGEHFVSLGIVLQRFSITRIAVQRQGQSVGFEVSAQAELWDEQARASVTLDNRNQKFSDTLVATLKFSSRAGQPRDVHQGDEFSEQGVFYRIVRIQAVPAEVVVTRQKPGTSLSETATFRIDAQEVAKEDPTTSDLSSVISRPATGIVTQAKYYSAP